MPFVAALLAAGALTPGYLNVHLSFLARGKDLVSRMTLQEEIAQMQHVAPAIPRLGVPAYTWWSEALHGTMGSSFSTVFPQSIGMGATFDPALLHTEATAISDEGRARYYAAQRRGHTGMHEGLTFWAPNINIFRDPRWGRGQETYGEDPYLTGQMAIAFVTGMQGNNPRYLKTVSTPKHFAVHDGPDPERHHFSAQVDPRDMWMTYFPAFRAAVVQGHAYSIMAAYSAVNGVPDPCNPFLLQTVLRNRWKFKGYVVSDCGAIFDIVYGHHYAKDLPHAVALAVKAGCDLECGDAYKALVQSVAEGLISKSDIDRAVTRLFTARMKLGMFDPPSMVPYSKIPQSVVDSPAHRALAKKGAEESIVLVKNMAGFLPLNHVHSIALVGPTADDRIIPMGNYNGTPSKLDTVLDGMRKFAPAGVRIRYAKGCDLRSISSAVPVPTSATPGGFDAQIFSNPDLRGQPVATRHDSKIDFVWNGHGPTPSLGPYDFSIRWRGSLRAKRGGLYSIGLVSDDGCRVWVDGKEIVNDWSEHPPRPSLGQISLQTGQKCRIKIEYFQHLGGAEAHLVWAVPNSKPFSDALDAARKSDVIVAVMGLSGEIENEELDRKNLDLPLVQQKFLRALIATGKPIVLVIESGSDVIVPYDNPHIKGILEAWYPGEAGGDAVAEELFGKVSPSGRLPVTFYKSLSQVLPIADYWMKGRTYRYMKARPAFGFGYGLSYSRFSHKIVAAKALAGGGFLIEDRVTNTGKMAADEVAQAYVSRDGAVWPEPNIRLGAFQRVHLNPGESKLVSLRIPARQMAVANIAGQWMRHAGVFHIFVGGGQPSMEPSTSGKDCEYSVRLDSVRVK